MTATYIYVKCDHAVCSKTPEHHERCARRNSFVYIYIGFPGPRSSNEFKPVGVSSRTNIKFVVLSLITCPYKNLLTAELDFAGGDKPLEKLKPLDSDEVIGYQNALADLVKTVSVAHFVGKTPTDFRA